MTLSLIRRRRRRIKALGAVGAAIVPILIVVALFAEQIAPFDPYTINAAILLQAPSPAHWMGSDEFGRGILDWIIRGSRISLYVAVYAVGLGTIVGAVFGLNSGYFGGKPIILNRRVFGSGTLSHAPQHDKKRWTPLR